MIKLLGLVKYFDYIYPVKIFCHRKICKYFYDYHIYKILKEANSNYKISPYPYYDLFYVFEQPSFRGLVKSLFHSKKNYVTCKDIAIAVSISIQGYRNKDCTYNKQIIDFAYHFSSRIKEIIELDRLLSEEWSRLDKKLELINDNINSDEIIQALLTKKSVFELYFKTFEDPKFNEKITIWHESEENTWIDWQKENSITIRIDRQKIREGFFLLGFDYSSDSRGSLSRATNVVIMNTLMVK